MSGPLMIIEAQNLHTYYGFSHILHGPSTSTRVGRRDGGAAGRTAWADDDLALDPRPDATARGKVAIPRPRHDRSARAK